MGGERRTHGVHLVFRQVKLAPSQRTKAWEVESKMTGRILAVIKWYSPWRRYTLQPRAETIWDKYCLDEVTMFIEREMEARK
jgi:hypothetical protein